MHTLYREFTSQAQIDAEYNASLSVTDPTGEIRRYVEASRRAVDTLPSLLDVAYGPTRAETLDIFPAAKEGAPIFVFFHGGYWRAFTSKEFGGVALGLQPLGITTIVVNYALCPHVTIDEIVRQARAAVAWVHQRIAAFGGDPGRIGIGGHSAGAHLAAMCLETPWAEEYGLPADPIGSAALVSGVFDIEPLRWSYLQPQIQLDDGIIRRNSPLFGIRSCPATLRVTYGAGESREFARQSEAFHAAWRSAGNQSTLVPIAGAHHFSAVRGLESPESDLCQWIARTLEPGARGVAS
jgi:arylformamidase